ncbi:Uncharacterised protein [Mycobacterium tuberculosis]|nr:Uncharacterised protein [Mycobacterium tuberculosis]
MGDRLQRVDGMQLPTRLVRVVHPAHPKTQLESQFGFVAQPLGDPRQ